MMPDSSEPMRDATGVSDEDLARAAKRGDVEAYDRLVRRHLRTSMAIAAQFAPNLADAEDIVQEAFHRMVRSLGDYDADRPFRPWLYTIVRNQARSTATKDGRRRALAPAVPLDREPAAPSQSDPALVADVERAIGSLPRMQQACVRLCDLEGFTSAEAAAVLGIDDGTVRTHLHRARKQLRTAMAH